MNSEAILPQTTPAVAMIRTLGLIAAICGLIIVAAYQGTYDAVQENKRIAVERAVFKVIPAAKSIVEYAALPTGGVEKIGASGTVPAGALKFYAGYDDGGGDKEVGALAVAEAAEAAEAEWVRSGSGGGDFKLLLELLRRGRPPTFVTGGVGGAVALAAPAVVAFAGPEGEGGAAMADRGRRSEGHCSMGFVACLAARPRPGYGHASPP